VALLRGEEQRCGAATVRLQLQQSARVDQQAQAGNVAKISRFVSGCEAPLVSERVVRVRVQQRLQRSFAAPLGGEAQYWRVALAPARVG
jgi:hypothetical protein